MTDTCPPADRRGLLSELLGGCGLDGLPLLVAAEAMIDRLDRSAREAAPCE